MPMFTQGPAPRLLQYCSGQNCLRDTCKAVTQVRAASLGFSCSLRGYFRHCFYRPGFCVTEGPGCWTHSSREHFDMKSY
ncbi:hypothetical protein I79_012982 [Cricetulus griseus]|uniref:Uncharacterized protein n=1 Tax=Cricetulus griseus TaxID=10029 RepID=G3HQ87_CRIGR|nr:hypothetical protein I79_012982 [Cricetulus griseus]